MNKLIVITHLDKFHGVVELSEEAVVEDVVTLFIKYRSELTVTDSYKVKDFYDWLEANNYGKKVELVELDWYYDLVQPTHPMYKE